MVPRTSYPPVQHHPSLTEVLTPAAFQTHLSNFLLRTQSKAHLHPDSYLSTSGIRFSAHSGPNGGLAIHHLRRIDAGLKGESLVQETEEQLARFHSLAEGENELLPESNDTKLDSLMLDIQQGDLSPSERKRRDKKRKRQQEIESWADETSSQAEAPLPPYQEIESFATTPMHIPQQEEWQDQAEYEQQQQPWMDDVDPVERAGAPVVKQGGQVPKVVESEQARKRERKEKKKAKKEERRREMAEKLGRKGTG